MTIANIGPPSFLVNLRMKGFRMRYDITANLASSVVFMGPQALVLAAKSSVPTNANILGIFEAVRIRSVTVWGPAVTAGTNGIGLEFVPQSGFIAPGINTIRTNDSSTSTTGSSMVRKVPEKGSLQGQWMNASSMLTGGSFNSLGGLGCYAVQCPANGILDVVLDCIVSDGSNPAIYSSTAVTAQGQGILAITLAGNIIPQDYNTFV